MGHAEQDDIANNRTTLDKKIGNDNSDALARTLWRDLHTSVKNFQDFLALRQEFYAFTIGFFARFAVHIFSTDAELRLAKSKLQKLSGDGKFVPLAPSFFRSTALDLSISSPSASGPVSPIT
jgi:hypothetical protein